MHPEDLDRLRRTGEVYSNALYRPEDYQTIADLCREEFALKLYSFTAIRHNLLTGRERATCHAEGLAKNHLTHSDRILKIFVDRRLTLRSAAVVCSQVVPKHHREDRSLNTGLTSELPDPAHDDFTVVEWDPDTEHYDRFPHLILLVRPEEPRVYTVLPMDPAYLEREDVAFEVAKIFSVYSQIDLCLALTPDKCVYIRKDGTYKRSCNRPCGGALAHRSLTGPHLYALHLEPLKAALEERPDAFIWYDEFETDPELFTGRDYSHVETVATPGNDIVDLVKKEISHVLEEFRPMLQREWDGDRANLKENATAWAKALDVHENVRVIGPEDLPHFSSHPLAPSEFLTSPLYTVFDSALDVMESDLKRSGLFDLVSALLQPVYTASHYGYLKLVAQSTQFAGTPDNETFWSRIQGQVFPAAACSPVTLLRLEVWQRIEKFYRELVPAVDTNRGSYERTRHILASLPLLKKVNQCGPMWIWQNRGEVCITPAVVVRFNEEGEPHCDDGPAIIRGDGTKETWIHGEHQ